MEKHDEFTETGFLRLIERVPQPFRFPCHKFTGMGFSLLIPADDLSPSVQIKRTFKCKSLRSHKGVLNLSFMVSPDSPENIHGLVSLEAEMQVAERV